MAIRRRRPRRSGRGGGLAGALPGAGPASRAVPAPILLCHLEGLTYQQAAERLGCPVRTVQSRLARGRERLRDRLARARRGAGDRWPDRRLDPGRRNGGSLRVVEARDSDGGGPLCSGRDRGRLDSLDGRCNGRRSFDEP